MGATNILGTTHFKWLADGRDVMAHYSNWYVSNPDKNVNKRNAIVCKSLGYSLVSIKSSAKQLLVSNTIVKLARTGIWLGDTTVLGTN